MIINKPPMGWNTWNTFAHNINEELIFSAADALVETGLSDLGYKYIVIDDCWAMRERDKNGKLVPDPEKFPHGMKYVADYIHKKGLKFGMYSSNGTMTCEKFPASYNREFIDAKTFASWDVDFLKYDNCFHPSKTQIYHLYRRMGIALANCGRDILFSACSWGEENTNEWIGTTGANMWRSTGDIFDNWTNLKDLIMKQSKFFPYHKKGCFNDMDMLIVGMHGKGHVGINGCTNDEYKLHFALWCLLGSPLMIGCDIRNMDEETREILSNKDLIAISQDERSNQPYMVDDQWPDEEIPCFARLLENGDIALGIFNLSDSERKKFISFEDLEIPFAQGKTLEGIDLFTKESHKFTNETIDVQLKPHSCRVYRLKVKDIE